MLKLKTYQPRFYDKALAFFFKLAASGYIPAAWFVKGMPCEPNRAKKIGSLNIEIVSHCWNYSHMLAYQLSSLVNYPPTKASITMTIFYNSEDVKTSLLLKYFGEKNIPNVTWNWQELPKEMLFRRSIGRNKAALKSQADWVWFADCDIMFNENCIDSLVDSLQGCNDVLVFPKQEKTTPMLPEDHPLLKKGGVPQVVSIKEEGFENYSRSKATGEFQITHGDVARAIGYCANISVYQTPSNHWCKCVEDRAFRWLVGTHGKAINIDNVYQIRHLVKGRYKKGTNWSKVRSKVRRLKVSLT